MWRPSDVPDAMRHPRQGCRKLVQRGVICRHRPGASELRSKPVDTRKRRWLLARLLRYSPRGLGNPCCDTVERSTHVVLGPEALRCRRQHDVQDADRRLPCARADHAIDPQGRFVSLIGPSGCGKSTIFNIIAGLLEPTSGRVLIDGVDATGTIGRVGYMLQKDLLLPWRTVLDNTILGMEIQHVPLRAARERALPLLHRYGLAGFEYLYPNALSGGMRQRAALLRTLLFDTDVILLDEPFGALDAQTKLKMQEWLMQLWGD